jgi:hypothetical protein
VSRFGQAISELLDQLALLVADYGTTSTGSTQSPNVSRTGNRLR